MDRQIDEQREKEREKGQKRGKREKIGTQKIETKLKKMKHAIFLQLSTFDVFVDNQLQKNNHQVQLMQKKPVQILLLSKKHHLTWEIVFFHGTYIR